MTFLYGALKGDTYLHLLGVNSSKRQHELQNEALIVGRYPLLYYSAHKSKTTINIKAKDIANKNLAISIDKISIQIQTKATKMSSQAQINKLAERYPFDDSELEQLIRCHAALLDMKNTDSFLTKIGMSSPYSYFFLPGNEMRRRIELIEDKILPVGFGSCLRAAMSVDQFVDCANEGDLSLERFLEGVADCGQRGHADALRVIWDCCTYIGQFEDKLAPSDIVDLCYRLALAAEVVISPDADSDAIVARLESEHDGACSSLEKSLALAGDENGMVTKQQFFDWVSFDTYCV